MVNHSIFSRGIKYDNMNILAWTILKNTQILNGCETFAFKYINPPRILQIQTLSFRNLALLFYFENFL